MVVRFTTRRALRRLIWAPNELGFARAYVSGDVEIEGDLLDGLTRLNALADPERDRGCVSGRTPGPPSPRPSCASARWGRLRGRRPRRSGCPVTGTPRRGTPRRSPTTTTSATTSTSWSWARRWSTPAPTSSRSPRRLHAGGRAARQARPRGAQAGAGPGMRLLDVGLRLGLVRHPRRPRVRRDGRRGHPLRGAGRLRPRGRRVDGSRRPGRDPGAGLPRRSPTGRTTRSPASGWPSTSGCPSWASTRRTSTTLLAPGGRLLNHAISRRPGPPGDPQGRQDLVHRPLRLSRR